MIFFTTELRLPLNKPLSKLLVAISNLLLAMTSLTAIAVPVAFWAGTIGSHRMDHFFYALFLLCLIPAALEHIITIFHDNNQPTDHSCDPDTERTETP
jgi:hypothetical protein